MTPPRRPSEAGFDDVRIVEKDIVEARLRSSFLKFTTGTDGLLILTLFAMLAATFLVARVSPGASQYLSTLQAALGFGR
jgi:hypothetical protein